MLDTQQGNLQQQLNGVARRFGIVYRGDFAVADAFDLYDKLQRRDETVMIQFGNFAHDLQITLGYFLRDVERPSRQAVNIGARNHLPIRIRRYSIRHKLRVVAGSKSDSLDKLLTDLGNSPLADSAREFAVESRPSNMSAKVAKKIAFKALIKSVEYLNEISPDLVLDWTRQKIKKLFKEKPTA